MGCKPRVVVLGAVLALQLGPRDVNARTWHITPDGTGDAPTIQAGMNLASAGDTVLLAPGAYTRTSQGTTGENMVTITPGVSLLSSDGAAVTTLDGELAVRILLCRDVGTVHIEGLRITRGFCPPSICYDFQGGGIYSTGSSTLFVRNCVFQNNQISGGFHGGAISCLDLGPTIEDCLFESNRGTSDAGGGAIAISGGAVRRCTFRGNRSSGDAGARAGAIECYLTSIEDCLFEGNTAQGFRSGAGGAVVIGGGSITRCLFVNNQAIEGDGASKGGAVCCGNTLITNSIFLGNKAYGSLFPSQGGAIAGDRSSDLTVRSCTLVGNQAVTSSPITTDDPIGGIYCGGTGTIESTIIASSVGKPCSGTLSFSCSDLFGNSRGDAICGTDQGGNLSVDPQFCASDPITSRDVTLRASSPCATGPCGLIGAGPVACPKVAIEQRSWSEVKSLYRR